MTPGHVVIAGGSIAAVTAAATLRAEGFAGRITMLAEEAQRPYTRVPLSKGLLAGTETASSVDLATGADVDLRLATPALALDVAGRAVETARGRVGFDGLVIATGARARRLDEHRHDVLVLRTLDDGARLARALADAASVLVVGGGVLGMEIASTAVRLGRAVTVVDVAPPLARLLGPFAGELACAAARDAGVELVEAPGGVRLLDGSARGVETDAGTRTADLVVCAVGDVPNVEWLDGSGLRIAGGVVADVRCRVAPHVVAAGDVAVVGGGPRTPTWTSAVEQGRVAALALLRGDDAPPVVPSRYMWTELFGLQIKLVGEPVPRGAPTVVDGDIGCRSALLAWPSADAPRTMMAFDHPTPVGRLKRMLAR